MLSVEGRKLVKSVREYKTVRERDSRIYSETEKLNSISSIRRVNRSDLYLEKAQAKNSEICFVQCLSLFK